MKTNNVGRVASAGDLFDFAKRIGTQWQTRGPIWYRGHTVESWKLRPKVYRYPEYTKSLETNLGVEFLRRAPTRSDALPRHNDSFGWLHLMQHYGAPTRLLDWTASILIAAFFAVEDRDRDGNPGVIWALHPAQLNLHLLGLGPLIAAPTNPVVAKLADNAFDPGMLNRDEPHVAAVYPIETDNRMLMQQATCTIHAGAEPLEEWTSCGSWLASISIAPDCRPTLREQLSLVGITRATLFPDLPTLADEISSPEFIAKYGPAIEPYART